MHPFVLLGHKPKSVLRLKVTLEVSVKPQLSGLHGGAWAPACPPAPARPASDSEKHMIPSRREELRAGGGISLASGAGIRLNPSAPVVSQV